MSLVRTPLLDQELPESKAGLCRPRARPQPSSGKPPAGVRGGRISEDARTRNGKTRRASGRCLGSGERGRAHRFVAGLGVTERATGSGVSSRGARRSVVTQGLERPEEQSRTEENCVAPAEGAVPRGAGREPAPHRLPGPPPVPRSSWRPASPSPAPSTLPWQSLSYPFFLCTLGHPSAPQRFPIVCRPGAGPLGASRTHASFSHKAYQCGAETGINDLIKVE